MQTGSSSQSARQALVFALALVLVAIATGISAWLFLEGLEIATSLWRANRAWFLAAPIVGALTIWVYSRAPASCSRGTDFVVALLRTRVSPGQIESQARQVPYVLVPLIVAFTWLSHVAGLSVGREGTAVQMGGGIASSLARQFGRLLHNPAIDSVLLKAGVAAGFGAVFGVPLAGAMFALEIAHRKQPSTFLGSIGEELRIFTDRNESGSPFKMLGLFALCALVSFGADFVALSLGATHFDGRSMSFDEWIKFLSSFRGGVGIVLLVPSLAFAAWLFLVMSGGFRKILYRVPMSNLLKIVSVGLLVGLFFYFIPHADRYAGLGTNLIASSFQGEVWAYDVLLKLSLTAICVGVGFKGGEVTPLLASGAVLGASLESLTGASGVHPLASIGMVGIFAVAARVPIAGAVMAGETFGLWTGVFALPVLLLANACVRRPRLYTEI